MFCIYNHISALPSVLSTFSFAERPHLGNVITRSLPQDFLVCFCIGMCKPISHTADHSPRHFTFSFFPELIREAVGQFTDLEYAHGNCIKICPVRGENLKIIAKAVNKLRNVLTVSPHVKKPLPVTSVHVSRILSSRMLLINCGLRSMVLCCSSVCVVTRSTSLLIAWHSSSYNPPMSNML